MSEGDRPGQKLLEERKKLAGVPAGVAPDRLPVVESDHWGSGENDSDENTPDGLIFVVGRSEPLDSRCWRLRARPQERFARAAGEDMLLSVLGLCRPLAPRRRKIPS